MTQSSHSQPLSFSDSCKVLGVNEHISEEDLKVAFHKKALLFHPDRFFNAPQSEQQAAERKFREAKAAYEQVASRFKSPEPSGTHFYYPGTAAAVNPVLKRRTNILIASGITLGCLLFAGAYTVFHMRPMYVKQCRHTLCVTTSTCTTTNASSPKDQKRRNSAGACCRTACRWRSHVERMPRTLRIRRSMLPHLRRNMSAVYVMHARALPRIRCGF
jgi:hypothetical protein